MLWGRVLQGRTAAAGSFRQVVMGHRHVFVIGHSRGLAGTKGGPGRETCQGYLSCGGRQLRCISACGHFGQQRRQQGLQGFAAARASLMRRRESVITHHPAHR